METDLILLLVGGVVGAMNAIAGGGMLVGLPVMIATGIPPITASATGVIVTSPGQLASAIGYWKYLRKVPLVYVWLLVPIVIGAAAGSLLLRGTSPSYFAELLPVLVLFGVGLFAFQPLMHFHLHKHLKGRAKSNKPIYLLALAVLPVSFYGGYFGAGFGFLMLAFLSFTKLPDVHMMNAMKNVSAVFLSVTSMVCLFGSQLIDWRIGALMAIGSIIGGYGGARYAQKVSSHWLRAVIIIIGLTAVMYLGYRTY
jgi:uncharacterized membrane protein YfcA